VLRSFWGSADVLFDSSELSTKVCQNQKELNVLRWLHFVASKIKNNDISFIQKLYKKKFTRFSATFTFSKVTSCYIELLWRHKELPLNTIGMNGMSKSINAFVKAAMSLTITFFFVYSFSDCDFSGIVSGDVTKTKFIDIFCFWTIT
jgi:hypothetical protein